MPKKIQRKYLIIIILLLVSAATVAYYFFDMRSASAQGGGFPPSAVNVAAVKIQDWQNQIQATGTLNALQGTLIKPEVAGRVTKIYFKSGETVKQGAPLIEINPTILQANLETALAQQTLNTGNYTRATALYKRGFLSRQDLDTAKQNMDVSIANVKSVQAQLDQNIIHAPFDGKLGIYQVNVGDYVQIGQAMVNLQTLNPLRIDFPISESDLAQVHIGDAIQLQNHSFPGQLFTGKIAAIDSAIDIATRTVLARAFVENKDEKLLPGGFAQVTIFAGKTQPQMTLPETAIVYDAASNYVYTVVNNIAKKTPVTVLEQNSHQVAVASSGLHVGDQVVTDGQLKISDGAPVYVLH